MPVTLNLMENDRIVHYVITEPWVADDLIATYKETKRWYDEAKQKIHLMVDVQNAGRIPPGALRARQDPALTHPMAGQIVVIGTTGFARAIADVVVNITRNKRTKFVDSEEEGWKFLREVIAEEAKNQESPKPEPLKPEPLKPEPPKPEPSKPEPPKPNLP